MHLKKKLVHRINVQFKKMLIYTNKCLCFLNVLYMKDHSCILRNICAYSKTRSHFSKQSFNVPHGKKHRKKRVNGKWKMKK